MGIRDRINALIHIEEILDNNSLIFKYNKNANSSSKIEAEYLFVNIYNEKDIFTFVDQRDDSPNKYCRSFFPKEKKDCTQHQMRMTLLYKQKFNTNLNASIIQLDKLTKQ